MPRKLHNPNSRAARMADAITDPHGKGGPFTKQDANAVKVARVGLRVAVTRAAAERIVRKFEEEGKA